MKKGNRRSNALLIELLIVVLFFSIASTILLRMFSTASRLTGEAATAARALNLAQNAADGLIAADDEIEALKEMGFTEKDGVYTLNDDGVCLRVSLNRESREAGEMTLAAVAALSGDKELLILPVSKYTEADK